MRKMGDRSVQVAVIGRDGKVEYIVLPPREEKVKPTQRAGKVVFPFAGTDVHSDTWRAGDHVTLTPRKKN